MWQFTTDNDRVRAELNPAGRHIRALKHAFLGALVLVVGLSVITLPDSILTENPDVNFWGRLAWHGFLGLLLGVTIAITRWNHRTFWIADTAGIYFDATPVGGADIPADSIGSIRLRPRQFGGDRLVADLSDGTRITLCNGGAAPEDLQRALQTVSQWLPVALDSDAS